jgi:cysteine synthase A
MIFQTIVDTIGNTPIVKVHGFEEENRAEVYAKLEFFNPGGSAKDRIGKMMLLEMEKRGDLKPGATIVEPTSGNTGIGLAMVAAARGYKAVFVMPETMSNERKLLLKAFGAELVLTPGAKGMKGSIEEAERLEREEGYVMMKQFDNPDNVKAHVEGTALEILKDLPDLDAFVAGVGTGGTLTGNAKVLKEHNKDILVCAVEPATSAVLSKEPAGPHKIQGIGAGFIPSVMDMSLVNRILKVEDEEAYQFAVEVAKTQGLLLGVSGGAALSGALKIAKELGPGKKVLFIAPDNGERYLSTGLYE